ncbi:hypothetical protein TUZN_2142 [Thermoproteus uzoniensis 768-20]|uniref:Uncharacterized protein n=1 Tax=Thermoproteus uzoniensis (strain 768-20) TaxID=999630 RepID=F2L5Q3_THEU7|nr:hypothetical protein [Thermoproteus uzoniensis]AEA13599.1 hypothetical protein TUZN_2142 [Thermoproteus uzoniensis 768-20]
MDFWLLRLRNGELSRGKPPFRVSRLRCAKCGAEVAWEEASYIRISDGRVVAYCRACLTEDLKAVGLRIV